MENKHHTSCNSLIGADRDRSRTARSRGMFCCRFPAKSHSRRRCALTVTSLQGKCGHFAWFIWQPKMNAKVEDLTWRFVILYGFPEPVRFQSTYFSNCILSFTNSVNAQTSCSWYMQNRWRHLFIYVSTGFSLFIAVTWIVVLTYEILLLHRRRRPASSSIVIHANFSVQCLNTICTITILDLDKISFNFLRLIISFCSCRLKLSLI